MNLSVEHVLMFALVVCALYYLMGGCDCKEGYDNEKCGEAWENVTIACTESPFSSSPRQNFMCCKALRDMEVENCDGYVSGIVEPEVITEISSAYSNCKNFDSVCNMDGKTLLDIYDIDWKGTDFIKSFYVNKGEVLLIDQEYTIPVNMHLWINEGGRMCIRRPLTISGQLLNHGNIDVSSSISFKHVDDGRQAPELGPRLNNWGVINDLNLGADLDPTHIYNPGTVLSGGIPTISLTST